MPCSFLVIHVSMHKMAYQKETVMYVWRSNLPITASMHVALNMKGNIVNGRALISSVEHLYTSCSFRVMNVGKERNITIPYLKFELSIFSTLERVDRTQGVYFAT